MSTFGGGYKIDVSATSGQVLTSVQCAFVTYAFSGTLSIGVPQFFTVYYGPSSTISASVGSGGNVGNFFSGIVFKN